MKQIRKSITVFFVISLLAITSIVSFSAETFYGIDGFVFTKSNGGVYVSDYTGNDTDLVIPETLLDLPVLAIYQGAFCDNTDLTSVSFPESLNSVFAFSFRNASKITSINFSTGLSQLSLGSFQECTSLKQADLSMTKLSQISNQAFYKCSSLEKVVLPETCTEIRPFAFADCSSLNYIYIPASVTNIDKNAFSNDNSIKIYCYKDSYAQQFAEENSINFEIIPEYEIGDVDLSGIIDIRDATLIQSYSVTLKELSDYQLSLADVNGDGAVNVADATQIQRILVGLV